MQPDDIPIYRNDSKLPPQASFLRLEGSAVISSLRWINDGLEVRLFNLLTTTTENQVYTEGWLEGLQIPQWIQPVDMESNPKGEQNPINQPIQIRPKQILIIRLF